MKKIFIAILVIFILSLMLIDHNVKAGGCVGILADNAACTPVYMDLCGCNSGGICGTANTCCPISSGGCSSCTGDIPSCPY